MTALLADTIRGPAQVSFVPNTEAAIILIGAFLLGCYTCRLRRKKCDEAHPSCRACNNLCVKCEYDRPDWWSSSEQRKIHKERIKIKIKQTKLNEKNQNALTGIFPIILTLFKEENLTSLLSL